MTSRRWAWIGPAALLAAMLAAPPAGAVDYGPISHKGMKNAGAAPTGLKLKLQIGLEADNGGVKSAVKAASNPASATYGQYPTLSELKSNWGATKSVRNGVKNAFANVNVTASIDVTHLRASATVTIKKAQKLFGTKWNLYETSTPGELVALPKDQPALPKGLKGNADVIAGMRLTVQQGKSSRAAAAVARPPARSLRAAAAAGAPFDGGTPTRTGTAGASCLDTTDPAIVAGTAGLFPTQLLTAYGVTPLQAAGYRGQGVRLAIVGSGPTPTADVDQYRSCFGFSGTSLTIHGGSGDQPIIESSLDAMVVSMVAPQLDRFDLWVRDIDEDADDGDVLGFLKLLDAPLQATANGLPLPHVISVSYGVCEPTVSDYTASRKLVKRTLAAEAALGIAVVVAAGDAGSSACAHGVPASQLTSADEQIAAEWPATSPFVLAVGGTNLTLTPQNAIAASGPWNDTVYPAPFTAAAGGGGGQSTIESRPWWQPKPSFSTNGNRLVPDVALFADESPGYPIVCSAGVQGCPTRSGQGIAFVGGTSAATPFVAGMIALWNQAAKKGGKPPPGFVPPLLYSIAARAPQDFYDVTVGGNAIFGGSCCPARPGYDLASGLGSPFANGIAAEVG
ncbi:MAG: S53 family peptidase [Solirubrobacteraceae bacterium]